MEIGCADGFGWARDEKDGKDESGAEKSEKILVDQTRLRTMLLRRGKPDQTCFFGEGGRTNLD
jgi:hypothetical protein